MTTVVPAPKIASNAKKMTSSRVRVLLKIPAQPLRGSIRAGRATAAVARRGTLGSPSSSSGVAAPSGSASGGGVLAMSTEFAISPRGSY